MMLAEKARQNIAISFRSGALIWSNVSNVNSGHKPMLSRRDVSVLLKCLFDKIRLNIDTRIASIKKLF